MSTTQQEITSVRQQIEAATEQLRALEQRAAEEATRNTKWHPKGGEFGIRGLCEVATVMTPSRHSLFAHRRAEEEERHTEAGLRWPTRAAAESALPFLAFFQRLVSLAQDLNPSGKVGGNYRVHRHPGGWTAGNVTGFSVTDPWDLFETLEAARKAADIMNRDKWVCPVRVA